MSITLHCQYEPDWLKRFVERCDGKLKYIVGVDVSPRYSGVQVFRRTYINDGLSNALVDMGAAGADIWIDGGNVSGTHVSGFAPVYAANPNDIFIGPNEYVLWSQAHVDRFNAFHVRYIQRMSALGHRVACGQLNTGWPRLKMYKDAPPYPETLAPTIAALWAHKGILTTHEYWPGLNNPRGNILRIVDTRAELIDDGILNLPDVAVTELGMDLETADPGSDFGHWGWRHFTDWPTYFSMLKAYRAEMDKYPWWLTSSIFTVGNWPTFNIYEPEAMELASWLAQYEPKPIPVPQPKAKGLYLSKNQQYATVETLWALWDEGYRAIGFRVTGPDNYDNPTHVEVDSVFQKLYPVAHDMGFLTYGFHYLHPGIEGGQARDFARAVEGLTFELGLYADLEYPTLDADRCERFVTAADRETGQKVHVYGRKTQLDAWRKTSDGKLWQEGRKLWLAAWTYDSTVSPYLPRTWTEKGYELWQYRNDGLLPATARPDRVCLDVWRGTTEELLEEYGEPENGEGEDSMTVAIVGRDGNPVVENGVEWDWEHVQKTYGLSVTRADVPDGEFVFRLKALIYDGSPETNGRMYAMNENGAPMPGVAMLLGIYPTSGTALGDNDAPQIAEGVRQQPEGRPNRALLLNPNDLNFTNIDGFIQHSLGSGSNYTPPRPATHWCWVIPGDNNYYTDVPAGFGMWDNHKMFWPVLQLEVAGDDNGNGEPVDGDLEGVIEQLKRIADAAETFGASFEQLASDVHYMKEHWPFS